MRYERHDSFAAPDDPDATIWRYIDFTKLVSLLDTESLFFARADTLSDAFEGSFSRANVAARPNQYLDEPEMLWVMPLAHRWFRLHTFINCWSLDEHESAALWRLYVPSQGGVAVKSTFGRLCECVASTSDEEESSKQAAGICIGRVQYIDYDRDLIPEGSSLTQFIHKRRSFEFEKEVRAVLQAIPVTDPREGNWQNITVSEKELLYPSSPVGESVKVNLDVLIEAVHVSPVAPARFSDLVHSVCARYGLRKPVIQSSLAGDPLY
jgi:hypothetical protein